MTANDFLFGATVVGILGLAGRGVYSFYPFAFPIPYDNIVYVYHHPYTHIFGYLYSGLGIICFFSSTYNSGKKSLLDHRKNEWKRRR